MPKQYLNHTLTASVSYIEKQALKRMAREKNVTLSALIRELVIAAVGATER